MLKALLAAMLALTMMTAARAAEFEAEQAFAELLFGRYFADPCANTSRSTKSCVPDFADKLMAFTDGKANQTYRFEENRCVVHADTTVTATGERFSAIFNLQNVLYVNLNKARQEGNLMEIELFLQGTQVIETDSRPGNVLVFIHKYYATDEGDIGHGVQEEVAAMRIAVKAYQTRFCGGFG